MIYGTSNLTRDEDPVPIESDDDAKEEDMDVLPPVPKITSFKEAIHSTKAKGLG